MPVHSSRTTAVHCSFFVTALVLLAGLAGVATRLSAQAHFLYSETYVNGHEYGGAYGVAIDRSGNVYTTNVNNGTLLKDTWSGGMYTETVISSDLNYPQGVDVDAGGNLYVADTANNRVLKLASNGTGYDSPVQITTTPLYGPGDVAVDASGRVYIVDTNHNRVLRETPNGSSWDELEVVSAAFGLNHPGAIAVDASGANIYIADTDNLRVLRVTWNAGTSSYNSPQTIASGLHSDGVVGVAVDGRGVVYVSDLLNSYGRVLKLTPSGGSYTQQVIVDDATHDLLYSHAIAVDGADNLYVADTSHGYSFVKFGLSGVDYGTVPVGATVGAAPDFTLGNTTSLRFQFDAATVIATPDVLLMGAANQDFTDLGDGGSTCYVDATGGRVFDAGTHCDVVLRFSPKQAGTRLGAVILRDSSTGAPLATAYVYGIGQAPQIGFSPVTQSLVANTALGSGFNGVFGVAVDGDGNVYIPDSLHNRVVKESLSGGSYSPSLLKSGTSAFVPQGIAVDGSGSIYIADQSGNVVLKETPSSGGYLETVVASGLWMPNAVTVDKTGNVYIADTVNNRVLKEKRNPDGSYTQSVVAGSGILYPRSVAVDSSGTVYFTDGNPPDRLLKATPQPDGSYTQSVLTMPHELDVPGLAVDGVGNLYLANQAENYYRVVKETLQPDGSYIESLVADDKAPYNLYMPTSVALDGSGNIFIGDGTAVMKENVADAPALDFGSVAAGTTSAALAVQVLNNGNDTLTAVSPGLEVAGSTHASDFLQIAGSGTPADCTAAFSLTPGAACNLSLEFTPAITDSGSVSGTATLTDNHLNTSPSAAQVLALSGTATAGEKQSQTITFANPGTINFSSTPTTLTATASSGLTVTFTSTTTSICTVTSAGELTTVAAGSCTIHADQSGDDIYNAASQVSRTFTIAAVVPGAPAIGTATAGDGQATVSFTAPSFTGGEDITSYTVTSDPGAKTGTGTASPITVTGLTNGTAYTFTVTASNSAGAGEASAASNSITPKGSQSITFDNPGNQNFGTSPTLVATATSGLTVTFSSTTTGVCTVSGATLTTVAAGSCTIHADQAGDAAYLAAEQVSRTFSIVAVVPGAPTGVTASAGNGQATVSFAAPSFTGGAPISGYTVTSSPGGMQATRAASPITVTGLTNGTAYTFTVVATNSAGDGAASDPSNSVTPNAALVSISVTPTNTSVAAGNTVQFTATGTFNDGSTRAINDQVTWSSSNLAVATISSAGLATGVAKGRTTIRATAGSITGSTSLTVSAPALQSISISPLSATIDAGATQAFTVTGHYSDGTSPILTGGIKWTSSDTAVATISKGIAKGVGSGTATITATAGGFSDSAVLTVNRGPLVSLSIAPARASTAVGVPVAFTLTGTYADRTTANLTATATWTSSAPAVATVTGGTATALASGKTTITGSVGSLSASATLTVK